MKKYILRGLILIFMFFMFLSLFGDFIYADYSNEIWTTDSFGYEISRIDSDVNSVYVYGIDRDASPITYYLNSYDSSVGTENYSLSSSTILTYFGMNDNYLYTAESIGSTITYRNKTTGVVVDNLVVDGPIYDVLVTNDFLFVFNNDSELSCYDLSDDSLVWQIELPGFEYGGPTVYSNSMTTDSDHIYVPLYVESLDDYYVRRYSIIDGSGDAFNFVYGSAIRSIEIYDQLVLIGGDGQSAVEGFYAYSLSDGELAYISDNYFGYIYDLKTDGEFVYVAGTGENKVISYNLDDGNLETSFHSYDGAIFNLSIYYTTLYAGGAKTNGEVIGYDISPYEITFDSDGGSVVDSQNVYSTELIEEPVPPTKAGYTFAGWYGTIPFVEIYDQWDFASFYPYSDLTLDAHWDADVYMVHFDSNGGSVVSSYYGITYGSEISRPPNPTKEFNNFVGWYQNEDLTDPWIWNSDVIESDLILYAKWKQDIGLSISDFFGDIGFNSEWGKTFISFILIIGVLILLSWVGANATIILFVMISLFILLLALNFIPAWIGIALMIVQFALLYITIKDSGGVIGD